MNTNTLGYNRDTLLAMLESRIVEIKFRKENNDLRVLRGTLREDMLPTQTASKHAHKDNPEVVTLWDLDAAGWRSVRTDRIIEVL
jgi:hypothetical protein